jgi:RecB family endonuclease NucS
LRLERQLEDFLAANPTLLEPGLRLYRDEIGRLGQQYPTDVGVIDLLCVRPSGQLLVVELKRSRASDTVVGQISRYIGWIKKNLADNGDVAGLILSHERDEALKYAVYANPNLSLRYFRLKLELVDEDALLPPDTEQPA